MFEISERKYICHISYKKNVILKTLAFYCVGMLSSWIRIIMLSFKNFGFYCQKKKIAFPKKKDKTRFQFQSVRVITKNQILFVST